jgi:serine/threonine-protein kinase
MSAPEALVGQTLLGKLKVVRLLGQGGMGAVYEVEHLITRHHRALKVMHGHFSASSETIARFIREAGVAGTLKTPHVVETYDAGQLEDGAPYVLMELLTGQTFGGLLESVHGGGPLLTPSRVVGIVCQVLEGLAVAHEAGIVHRDIKPDNIFVSEGERGDERVRILDFGISKFSPGIEGGAFEGTLTADHTVMGTPYYMSPEQVRGARLVDSRSDLYSVGVMLYEGLSGRRPFEAMNMASLAIKIHAGDKASLETIAPHLAPGLARIVERAMRVEPERRYESARALLEALVPYAESHYTAGLQTLRSAPSEGPVPMVQTTARKVDETAHTLMATNVAAPTSSRVPPWVLAAGAAAIALVLGLGLMALGAGGGPDTSAAAEAPVAEPPPAPPSPMVEVEPPPPPTAPEAPAPTPEAAVAEAPALEPAVRARRRAPRDEGPREEPGAEERPAGEGPRGRGTKLIREGIY